MSNTAVQAPSTHTSPQPQTSSSWRQLWTNEDYWSIWIGLGIVIAAYLLFANRSSIAWIAVTPPRWSTFAQIGAHLAANAGRYAAQFLLWVVLFGIAVKAIGYRLSEFVPAFVFVYVLSLLIFVLGQWTQASVYGFEPPLVALLLGLLISNAIGLPRRLDAGFRVEFYIKTGIVLLGATLPFTLIVWAGPVAILQASIVSLTTFFIIYAVARRLGLEQRFAATLGVGGAVCGVSAAIAISGAIGTRKEHSSIAIATVIVWAIVMIFLLPFVARLLELPAGIGGAWIGTSEFADAAGLAAAQSYGNIADNLPNIDGTAEQALSAFTLMKVVGRDVWIGIWAFVLAIVATTRWERGTTAVGSPAAQVWLRFPKFVLGFLVASLLVTAIVSGYTLAEYDARVTPALIAPIRNLRTWAFIFCFFSIGLTTRFGQLAKSGTKPQLAFAAGVVVNVLLGYVLSVWIFADHWRNLAQH
jgi:uncharacterized integral membrane protein (TIGR00698 family)